MFVARVDRPLLVEFLENRAAACLQCTQGVASIERLRKHADIDDEIRAPKLHGFPRGHQMSRRRTERLAQLAQRHAQAPARRFVEHVRPEPRGKPGSLMGARVESKVSQHRARPLRRGRGELIAIQAQMPAAGESYLEHRATVSMGSLWRNPSSHH